MIRHLLTRFVNWVLGPDLACQHGCRFSEGVCHECCNGDEPHEDEEALVEL